MTRLHKNGHSKLFALLPDNRLTNNAEQLNLAITKYNWME
jgi:hypothetical protein